MTVDSERKAFEAYAFECGWRNFTRIDDGYAAPGVQKDWLVFSSGWQARAKGIAAPPRELSHCPNCGSSNHEQRVGPDTQFPGAESPYRLCIGCGEQWENADTFRAREHIAANLSRDYPLSGLAGSRIPTAAAIPERGTYYHCPNCNQPQPLTEILKATGQLYPAPTAAATPEPVAWVTRLGAYAHISWGSKRPDDVTHTTPLYAAPAQAGPVEDATRLRFLALMGRERILWLLDHDDPPEKIVARIDWAMTQYPDIVARAALAAPPAEKA